MKYLPLYVSINFCSSPPISAAKVSRCSLKSTVQSYFYEKSTYRCLIILSLASGASIISRKKLNFRHYLFLK